MCFCEHQGNVSYGSGYKSAYKRTTDNAAIKRAAATANRNIPIRVNKWVVPHYTPNITQQRIISEQIVYRAPAYLDYNKRTIFGKDVSAQKDWNLEFDFKLKLMLRFL